MAQYEFSVEGSDYPNGIISKKNSAKSSGGGTTASANNNSTITIVNEGYHGAVGWKGSTPTPDGPIVVAESKYADDTLAPCDPPVGGIVAVGSTFNAPAASPTHGIATVKLLHADGTLSTITSGQSKTALEKTISYNITSEDLQEDASASSTLSNLNTQSLVVDIKKLDKKSNFNIDSPVGTAGIRG